jgi:hypothetical protein
MSPLQPPGFPHLQCLANAGFPLELALIANKIALPGPSGRLEAARRPLTVLLCVWFREVDLWLQDDDDLIDGARPVHGDIQVESPIGA